MAARAHREQASPEKVELVFSLAAGVLLLTGVLSGHFSWLPRPVVTGILAGSAVLGGWFATIEMLGQLRRFEFRIDFLMIVAAAGAAALGEWAEGAFLLFLFSLGHALEHRALGRARRAVEALAELAPDTALVLREGEMREIPVEQLVVGDRVMVKPDERVPADGFVVEGSSSVDQSPITGESVPVDKSPAPDFAVFAADPDRIPAEHVLFAGSINQSNALRMQVTRPSQDSAVARAVKLVSEAQTRLSGTQRFTETVERRYVPAVLVLVGLLLFAWLVVDEPFADSFYRAMAVLVGASPCALALATPSAVLSGVARAARGGVLIKGGGPLEDLGRVGAMAFDKTGTLTAGKPRLTDLRLCGDVSEKELLETAVAVERLSRHPLAEAVTRDGIERLGREPENAADEVESITGRGIRAKVGGVNVAIGKRALFSAIDGVPLPGSVDAMVDELERAGRTTMVVRRGDRYLGVLGLMDTPREAAVRAIARLRALGVGRLILLSGDNQTVAEAIARAVGIDEARGDLMPEDKVTAIRELGEAGGVAMVGDGVNDAPAMANATVGISMGVAGSDVALEASDIALMADNLETLPFAVGLSRAAVRIVRQNLWISLGTIVLLVPAAIFGLKMGYAVFFHEGSTVVVVLNALRLLGYRERSGPAALS